jgi:hypothetical protein
MELPKNGMDYDDFVIHLGTDGQGLTVRVARSPAGESNPEVLSLTLCDSEIAGFAATFSRAAEVARQDRHMRPPPTPEIDESSLAEIGARLSRSLFPETVRNLYQRSLGQVAERGRGLRIRIEMGLGNSALARLHAVPWEYLYLADDGHFLALGQETSIVRYLSLGLPGDRPPVPSPLSILVIAGEALVGSDLDLAQERRELERAWSEPGEVHIDVLPGCTLNALREQLLAREYHALHFMGHGGFDAAAGEGTLAFRDEAGRRVWVSGADLAEQLRDRSSLRLVCLNACKTAQAGSTAPYAGVATALLRAGIPAVVAMQFLISDAAALAFSRAFYRRIAHGDTVDAAVTEGRLAIRRLAPGHTEWGTPVLFERLTSGRIVELDHRPPPEVRSRFLGRAALAGAVLSVAFLVGLDFRSWLLGPTTSQPTQAILLYQGRVLDRETKEPIPGVMVSAPARGDVSARRTDERGNFALKIPTLSGQPTATAEVRFLRDGYEEHDEQIRAAGRLVQPSIFLAHNKKSPEVRLLTAPELPAQKPVQGQPIETPSPPAERTLPEVKNPFAGCPTLRNGFDDSASFPVRTARDNNLNVDVGDFGITAGEFKLSIFIPNNFHKRCVSCGDSAALYRVVSSVRSNSRAGTWGIYFLDGNEKWYTLELNHENRAAIKHYFPGNSGKVLWEGSFSPQAANRLEVEVVNNSIAAVINGKPVVRLNLDLSSLPKVPLGTGFIVASRSEPPVEAYFDDFELTTCER